MQGGLPGEGGRGGREGGGGMDVIARPLQEFLDELRSVGKLSSLSLWKELYPEIVKEQRYHDMLGQPGVCVFSPNF